MFEGLITLFIAQAIGSTILPVGTKIGVQTISPLFFVFGRFLFSVLFLLPLFLLHKQKSFSKKEYRQIFFLALFLFANVVLFTIAIQYTTAIMSQILYTATPIIVGIVGHYVFHGRLNKNKIIGLFIALSGVSFLIYQSIAKQAHLTFGTPVGNILIIIAMLGYSMYISYSGHLASSAKINSIRVTFLVFVYIAILLFFVNIAGIFLIKNFSLSFTKTGSLAMLFVGIGNALSYWLGQVGIRKTNAITSSLFQYLAPVMSGVVAVPLLHEKPSISLVIGGVVILIGVFYATTLTSFKKYLKRK